MSSYNNAYGKAIGVYNGTAYTAGIDVASTAASARRAGSSVTYETTVYENLARDLYNCPIIPNVTNATTANATNERNSSNRTDGAPVNETGNYSNNTQATNCTTGSTTFIASLSSAASGLNSTQLQAAFTSLGLSAPTVGAISQPTVTNGTTPAPTVAATPTPTTAAPPSSEDRPTYTLWNVSSLPAGCPGVDILTGAPNSSAVGTKVNASMAPICCSGSVSAGTFQDTCSPTAIAATPTLSVRNYWGCAGNTTSTFGEGCVPDGLTLSPPGGGVGEYPFLTSNSSLYTSRQSVTECGCGGRSFLPTGVTSIYSGVGCYVAIPTNGQVTFVNVTSACPLPPSPPTPAPTPVSQAATTTIYQSVSFPDLNPITYTQGNYSTIYNQAYGLSIGVFETITSNYVSGVTVSSAATSNSSRRAGASVAFSTQITPTISNANSFNQIVQDAKSRTNVLSATGLTNSFATILAQNPNSGVPQPTGITVFTPTQSTSPPPPPPGTASSSGENMTLVLAIVLSGLGALCIILIIIGVYFYMASKKTTVVAKDPSYKTQPGEAKDPSDPTPQYNTQLEAKDPSISLEEMEDIEAAEAKTEMDNDISGRI
jgi:hypothetical protein